ncbi:hypothetical protein FOA52_011370 [Chlamydomonas sp. UWO 241]|nr:hypothetical protein FOA52_011370 [Chlamydomonas sp. UWO 241]
MQRVARNPTSPGGPQVSQAKRRRLADLKTSLGANDGRQAAPASGSVSGPAPRGGGAAPTPGEFPYAALPDELVSGQLARYLADAGTQHSVSAGARASSHRHASSSSAGAGRGASSGRRSGGAPAGASALHAFVARLVATNAGVSADARSSAAGRVVDKTLLLDNPQRATGSAAALAGMKAAPTGFADRLQCRAAGRPSIVAQLRAARSDGGGGGSSGDGSAAGSCPRGRSAVRHADLRPLHAMWREYMEGLLPTQGVGQLSFAPASATATGGLGSAQLARGGQARGPPSGAAGGGGGGPAAASASEERLLASADLHGCELRVASCRGAVRHCGARGIVAALTRSTVCIVDEGDVLHVVPKKGSTFVFDVPGGRTHAAEPREHAVLGVVDVAHSVRSVVEVVVTTGGSEWGEEDAGAWAHAPMQATQASHARSDADTDAEPVLVLHSLVLPPDTRGERPCCSHTTVLARASSVRPPSTSDSDSVSSSTRRSHSLVRLSIVRVETCGREPRPGSTRCRLHAGAAPLELWARPDEAAGVGQRMAADGGTPAAAMHHRTPRGPPPALLHACADAPELAACLGVPRVVFVAHWGGDSNGQGTATHGGVTASSSSRGGGDQPHADDAPDASGARGGGGGGLLGVLARPGMWLVQLGEGALVDTDGALARRPPWALAKARREARRRNAAATGLQLHAGDSTHAHHGRGGGRGGVSSGGGVHSAGGEVVPLRPTVLERRAPRIR